jgi:6-phosphogluconolactonase
MRQSLALLCRMGLTAAFAACAAGSYGAGPAGTDAPRPKTLALNANRPKSQSLRSSKRSKMEKMLVYIGTYTTKGAKGIYLCELNMKTGDLSLKGPVATTPNPTFLALAPNHKYLYAANEVDNFQGKKAGYVSAWAIQPKTGALTLINESSTIGDGPCHVSIDNKGKYVYAANYGAGSLSAMPVEKNGGVGAATFVQHEGTSVDPKRQEGPHAHSIYVDAADHFAYSCDLGLDKVFVYKLDGPAGTLTPNDPPYATVLPGSGPRHIAFDPHGKFAYVINEMKSTVTAMKWDPKAGTMQEIETVSTVPSDNTVENSTAEVFIHPNGKFLYGSNRGHNSIAIFSVDQATGKVKLIGNQSTQGKTPRSFNLDPTGEFLLAANQDTDTVFVYRVNPTTGILTSTGHSVHISMPVCIVYMPE